MVMALTDDSVNQLGGATPGLALPQSAARQAPVPADINPLFRALVVEFQRRNRAITRTSVTELRQVSSKQSVVLAWGAVQEPNFRGRFEDQLHGVFLVDANLTRIERVLDIVPTPRWSDYRYWIDALTEDELIVLGEGATYGDSPSRRTYTIVDYAGERIDAAKKVVRLSPAAFRQLPLSVRKRLDAEGCQIPQSPGLESPHNVVSGHFASSTQLDWAVLCSVNGDSSVRIFWGGLASCPEFGRSFRDSGAYALELSISTLRWRVVIKKMSPDDVRSLARESDLQLSAPVHEGIQERYCESGKWIDLEPIP